MKSRAGFRKTDMWVIGGALAVALVFYVGLMLMGQGGGGVYGQIFVDGQVVYTAALDLDSEIIIAERPNVRFIVSDGAIAFIESDCPDKVCINVGFLRSPGQAAACLPNGVLLVISGDGGDSDVDIWAH